MEQTLLLNATYEPLKVVHWQKAMTLWCQGKVEVISVYDREVRSVSFSFKLPSVIRLLRYIKIKRQYRLRPVFAREHLRARRSLVPVLRRGVPDARTDVRPCRAGRPGRPQGLGEHRHLLHQLQPAERRTHAGRGRHASDTGAETSREGAGHPDHRRARRRPRTAGAIISTGTWSSTELTAIGSARVASGLRSYHSPAVAVIDP